MMVKRWMPAERGPPGTRGVRQVTGLVLGDGLETVIGLHPQPLDQRLVNCVGHALQVFA